jgi:hypothetical protein
MDVSDLLPGDVLLKYFAASLSNLGITGGQAAFSHNLHGGHANITHAALHIGMGRTAESQAEGLTSNTLGNMPYKYDVYRYKVTTRYNNRTIAEVAAEVGRAFLQRKAQIGTNFGKYNYRGGFLGFFRNSGMGHFGRNALDRTQPAGGQTTQGIAVAHLSPNLKLYCSAFVVFAYNYAALITGRSSFAGAAFPIAADYRNTLPKQLQNRLNKDAHWERIGRKVQFTGQQWIPPEERNFFASLAAGA